MSQYSDPTSLRCGHLRSDDLKLGILMSNVWLFILSSTNILNKKKAKNSTTEKIEIWILTIIHFPRYQQTKKKRITDLSGKPILLQFVILGFFFFRFFFSDADLPLGSARQPDGMQINNSVI